MATEGYGIVVTNEVSSFFQEIKGQDTKNESNIGLLNQLYDGRGDKSIFAGGRERVVPENATCMTLRVQPQPFFRALKAIGKTVWLDSGFREWFLFTTVRPFRYICGKYLLHMLTERKNRGIINVVNSHKIFHDMRNIQNKCTILIFEQVQLLRKQSCIQGIN